MLIKMSLSDIEKALQSIHVISTKNKTELSNKIESFEEQYNCLFSMVH